MRAPNLSSYHWHENNTQFDSWFERDRQMVRLTETRGREILCLWDDAVTEFVEDGFKSIRQSWQQALCEYATERKLRAK